MLRKNKIEILLVLGITLFALIVRLYQLPELFAFTYDQGRDMQAVSAIATGDIKLLGPETGGIQGFFLGPFYFYFLVPGFILSSGSPIGTTVWLTIMYSMVLPLSFYILKPIVGKKFAFLGFLLLALSPGSIAEARFMWNPSLAVPTLLLSWFFLFKSENKPMLLSLGLFFYGLTLQTELAYGLLLLPVYVWWIALHSPIKNKLQKIVTILRKKSNSLLNIESLSYDQELTQNAYNWKQIILSMLIASLTLIPQLVFELKNNFLLSKAVISNFSKTANSMPLLELWQIRPMQMADSLYRYVFGYVPGHEWLLIVFILSLVYMSTKMIKQKELFLLFVAVAPLFLSMFYGGNNGAFFPYYFSAHYLVVSLLVPLLLSKIKTTKIQYVFILLVAFSSLFAFYWSARTIYNKDNFRYTFNHQFDAYLRARQLAGPQNTIEVFTPNLRPIQYHYINSWYSAKANIEMMDINNNQNGATTVALVYEPPFSGGSLSSFRDWYRRVTKNKDCGPTEYYGFITVEVCTEL